MKQIVNILNYPASQSDYYFFVRQLGSVATNEIWLGTRRLFGVEFSGERLKFNGVYDNKSFSTEVQFVYSPPPLFQSINDQLLDDWISKFNSLIIVCKAENYNHYSEEIAKLRYSFIGRERDNDCILFLMDVDKVMTVGSFVDKRIRELSVYSALTNMPLSKETYLLQELSLDFFHGESSCFYYDNSTGRLFSMPRNVLCHFEDSTGQERLLTELCNRAVYQYGIILYNTYNGFFLNKLSTNKMKKCDLLSIFKKEKEIRLAVIGGTSNGKTYFLEDVCNSIKNLGYTISSEKIGDFGTILSFNAQNVNAGKTPRYFCRNGNLFMSRIQSKGGQSFVLSIIDIPGEVVQKSIYNATNDETVGDTYHSLYETLRKDKRKRFQVQIWDNGVKTVSYGDPPTSVVSKTNRNTDEGILRDDNGGMKGNLKAVKNNNIFSAPKIGSRNDAVIGKVQLFSDLWQKQPEKTKPKETKISGNELINNLYDYDADSVYYALIEACHNGAFTTIDREINENFIKYFRFYYFLYSATDVVLCHKVLNDNSATLETWFKTTCELVKGKLSDKFRVHLGIKGVDTYMDESFKTRYDTLLREKKSQPLNTIYLEFVNLLVDAIRKGDTQGAADNGTKLNLKNIQISKENSLKATEIIEMLINEFSDQTQSSINFIIPPQVFFLATPIDSNFKIGRFITRDNVETIEGGIAKSPGSRIGFGTIQMLVSILKANGIEVNSEYVPQDENLKQMEGIC